MPYNSKVLTSIHGRRLGLQRLTTAESGGSYGTREFLVGPEDMRAGVSTAAVDSDTLPAYGVSRLSASAGSSAVYTLDPPIPGVMKVIEISANTSSIYVDTKNAETITSTAGSSHTTYKSTGGAFGVITLMGVTTAVWAEVYAGTSFTRTTST